MNCPGPRSAQNLTEPAGVRQASKMTGNQLNGFVDMLRCPRSGQQLVVDGEALATVDGRHRYRLSRAGIVMFAENFASPEAKTQRHHYNKIAEAFTANLEYPHTREYRAYLDRAMLKAVGEGELGLVVELCCGSAKEAMTLFGRRARRYVGIDISENMLQAALSQHNHPNMILLQADATHVPLASESVDTVVTLGGIHHVPQRSRLFAEIVRILKPGGRFFYREPVSDLFLWRALRAVIYRLSPMLNHDTERALRYEETVPLMEGAGLRSLQYHSHGFLGFCLFMNSDVLFFNRLFHFVPGIG